MDDLLGRDELDLRRLAILLRIRESYLTMAIFILPEFPQPIRKTKRGKNIYSKKAVVAWVRTQDQRQPIGPLYSVTLAYQSYYKRRRSSDPTPHTDPLSQLNSTFDFSAPRDRR